jgi:epoxyqueuosine reductase
MALLTSQAVKNEARQLGLPLVGITTAEPPPHVSAYENWLKQGRQASMEYLATERARTCRRDPRLILPECRSILILAARYPDPKIAKPDEKAGPTGRVAAYAWGRDYHLVFPQRLQALVAFIEGQVGGTVPNRWYTDTGPILERDLAQRAGLGWIGKNTCLINPKLGSYFLLAEILLGIDLEPDPPFTADHCGNCTRCIEACPTHCILPDRTLDARRCISYLTIENKGEIPSDLRTSMGNWAFGCDVCQMVCPWNRFSAIEYDASFAPYPDVPTPDLIADLRLTPEKFKQKFNGNPVMRARRGGYLRNTAVALGNSRSKAGIPALEGALQEDAPLVRQHAGWALEQIRKTR